MCFVCGCLTWCMDVWQRAITFCLLTSLITILCIGFGVSIIAGIAYGYNYSISEFMAFAKSDVTIYMRRGQFNDRKYAGVEGLRRRYEEPGAIVNASADYQEPVPSTGDKEPLAETLVKTMDNTQYAEKLLKFAKNRISKGHKTTERHQSEVNENDPVSYYTFTAPPVHKISIVPNPAIKTTVIQRGNSEIIMRQFPPEKNKSNVDPKKDYEDYIYKIDDVEESEKIKSRIKVNQIEETSPFPIPDKKIPDNVPTRRPLPITHGKESTTEDDEDDVDYRR